MKKYISLIFVAFFGLGIGAYILPKDTDALSYPVSCDIVSMAAKQIGTTTREIMPAISGLTSARIQVVSNASSTVFLSFAASTTPATVGNGLALNVPVLNGATSTPYIDIGLGTPFAYTGPVSAIVSYTASTASASTTILVTTCR